MLGLSRNTLFAVGGVLLVGVLYLGFSGSDDATEEDAKVATGKKKNKRKKKRSNKGTVSEGGVGVAKMCAKLDCSEAQLTSFKDMVKAHRKQTSTQRRALAGAHAKIAAELAEETLDTAALDDAFADAAEQRAAIDDDARGVLEAMHGKLSGPQREGLAKLVARHGPTMLLARPADGDSHKKSAKAKGKKGKRKGKGKRSSLRLEAKTKSAAPAGDTDAADGLSAPPIQRPPARDTRLPADAAPEAVDEARLPAEPAPAQ
ncbi:MAG: hypothetical protein ACE37F_31050 [Nannocystaceae bacterium]|nr:periplasmic heavy metal sensor [bacterium]